MRTLYSFGIHLYRFAIFLASFFNPKAKSWITGRKNWEEKLAKALASRGNLKHTFWFHCASLGEYEQALPVINGLKTDYPESFVLVSFFSPSGYENFKAHEQVNAITYLPADTLSNAKAFLNLVKPTAAFFVKYEIWHNFISRLSQQHIPVYLVSANFRPDQVYFKGYGSWFRQTLKKFNHIFVQQRSNIDLLQTIGITSCSVSGDTRIDRVLENLAEQKTVPEALAFLQDEKAIIVGSAWWEEVQIIRDFLVETGYEGKIIIAPHEVKSENTDRIAAHFANFSVQRFSSFDAGLPAQILIVDTIGQLKHLYAYAKLAFIGGGFGSGLHNILEAVTFGIPVFFGPEYRNFPEAEQLIRIKCAYPVKDSADFIQQAKNLLNNPMYLKVVEEMSRKYIRDNSGATRKIITKVEESIG
ncbi:MAG: glycosyltransferase N-terminal domain-containing protein [Bacteroidota bacterium]